MNIDGINTGYVIDHIRAGEGLKVYHLLKLDNEDCTVAIIQRAKSTKYGMKDIIKVDADIAIDCDILGYIDTNITVNRIKNAQLMEKIHLELPEKLTGVIRCKNPRCITSVEDIEHCFVLVDREKKRYRCMYCDTVYDESKDHRGETIGGLNG